MSFVIRKKRKEENPEKQVENGCFISYISEPPTLQHIAAVSIAIRLWTEPDIKEDIKQYSESNGFDSRSEAAEKIYKEYEKKVSEKLDGVLLTDKLKYKISQYFLPIGLQLFKGFAKEIEEYKFYGTFLVETVQNEDKGYCRFYDIFKMGGSVCWTMEGIIDNVTSLKELINNEVQVKNIYGLYELACKYCFEECIPYIWGKLPRQKKNELDYAYKGYDYHIVAYWTSIIKKKLRYVFEKLKKKDVNNIYDNNLSIEQNMISLSIFVKNPYSLKYFWNKLEEYERNIHLEKWLNLAISKFEYEVREYQGCNDKTNILCFLLSHLNDGNRQKEVFRAHSDVILKSLFYDWPWQRFFLPTFLIMMDYISEETFVKMMSLISGEVREGNALFRKIWLKSPLKLKKYLIQTLEDSWQIIYNFIGIDDVETIFEILKCATDAEIKQILFYMIEIHAFYVQTLFANKLSIIDTVITKVLITSEDIDHFKFCVMSQYGRGLCEAWIDENDFQAVEKLFAWGFKSPKEVREFKRNILDKNKMYSSLVCLGDCELVDRFMNWYFADKREINKFKKEFIHDVDDNNSSICSKLLWELSVNLRGWEYFEKFVGYHFSSPEEVTEFKSMFLESVTSFLEDNSFGFAHKFVMWCLGSIDEVNRFKNSFVTSEEGMKFVVRAVNENYPLLHNPNELIKWFSISKESAAMLKCKLNNIQLFSDYVSKTKAECKRWALLYMLNKHAGSDDTEYKENNIDKDNDITKEIMKAYKNRR